MFDQRYPRPSLLRGLGLCLLTSLFLGQSGAFGSSRDPWDNRFGPTDKEQRSVDTKPTISAPEATPMAPALSAEGNGLEIDVQLCLVRLEGWLPHEVIERGTPIRRDENFGIWTVPVSTLLAIKSSERVQIMAAPRIRTFDGQTAHLQFGHENGSDAGLNETPMSIGVTVRQLEQGELLDLRAYPFIMTDRSSPEPPARNRSLQGTWLIPKGEALVIAKAPMIRMPDPFGEESLSRRTSESWEIQTDLIVVQTQSGRDPVIQQSAPPTDRPNLPMTSTPESSVGSSATPDRSNASGSPDSSTTSWGPPNSQSETPWTIRRSSTDQHPKESIDLQSSTKQEGRDRTSLQEPSPFPFMDLGLPDSSRQRSTTPPRIVSSTTSRRDPAIRIASMPASARSTPEPNNPAESADSGLDSVVRDGDSGEHSSFGDASASASADRHQDVSTRSVRLTIELVRSLQIDDQPSASEPGIRLVGPLLDKQRDR